MSSTNAAHKSQVDSDEDDSWCWRDDEFAIWTSNLWTVWSRHQLSDYVRYLIDIEYMTIYCSKTLSAPKVEPIDHISTAESVSSHTQSEKNESQHWVTRQFYRRRQTTFVRGRERMGKIWEIWSWSSSHLGCAFFRSLYTLFFSHHLTRRVNIESWGIEE